VDDRGRALNLTQVQASTLNGQMQRDAVIADALFAVGGVLAATGVTLLIVGSVSADVAPVQGGAAIVVHTP
jgi:hypothetical protein